MEAWLTAGVGTSLLPDTSLRLWDTEMGMVRDPNLTTGMAACVRLQLQNTEHESKGTTEQWEAMTGL